MNPRQDRYITEFKTIPCGVRDPLYIFSLFSKRWGELSGVWQFWRLTRSAVLLHMWPALPWGLSGHHCDPAEEGRLAVSWVQSLPGMQVSIQLTCTLLLIAESDFLRIWSLIVQKIVLFTFRFVADLRMLLATPASLRSVLYVICFICYYIQVSCFLWICETSDS